ncbi:DUF1015 domain-containing protein [Thiorhodococcus mannitoliphagus]|uniref:DUF1015 domain-containing protein n=1 Tax=Thiorhodococcus mannitoliphagus TaxID=329406 RepID=A0A6P1DSG2_9GAMM|nr:DUF1015 family protein [Thiorhodococcus mannitoliphagus]NEX20490.1 DUF1015 domain-containing protein [Thiorhodococcus mannitoliphagus]
MTLIKPFAGLRPATGRAGDVAAPPYDVMNAAEARQMVEGRPWSFLHISRPEVDLPLGTDPYAPEVYAKARQNLERMIEAQVLIRDPSPSYYVYRLTMGDHRQTGLVGAASIAAYDRNRIKKHELTRPVKEDDRVRQIEALDAQTGPVFLVYRAHAEVDARLAHISGGVPDVDITAPNGVRHELWCITDAQDIDFLTQAFSALDALYVADGHHRSAAASRVAARRRQPSQSSSQDEGFLAVIFPHDQMQILDYNRVVRDLNGQDPAAFLERIRSSFNVAPSDEPLKPSAPAEYGMYLEGQWYQLTLDPQLIPRDDPVARLDVSLLQDHLIKPILGISDPRRDDRIDFVGGIRGLAGLAERVDSGEMAVAFSLYPTGMEDLMAVADAGEVMPPKSTWFEPKLADGLVSLVLDEH